MSSLSWILDWIDIHVFSSTGGRSQCVSTVYTKSNYDRKTMIERDIFLRAETLVSNWQGKENTRVPADVITEIFNVHNKIFFERQEHSRGCGGCRERVWNKLKTWYHENKHLYKNDI
jgi:hypothetical protein